jgi:hypothetical protein
MLLCQTAFAAKACAQGFGAPQAPGSAPCHEPGGMNGKPVVPASPSVCDAAQALSEIASVAILSIADLPLLTVVPFKAASAKPAPAPAHARYPACHPPPLTILHCRFLS